MRLGFVILCLAAMAWPAAARQDGEFYVVRPLPPKHCDLRRARPADLRTASTDPQAGAGECVKLTGILVGPTFFADLDAYSRSGGGLPSMADVDANRSGVLGLYGSDEVMSNLPDRPVRAVIAGVVGSCEALRGSNAMALGYCHYTDGGYFAVGEMDLGEPFTPRRLASDADRARIGDLQPLPAKDPGAMLAESRMRTWLAALRAGDRRVSLERAGGDPDSVAEVDALFAGRAWRWLRQTPSDIRVQVFQQVDDPGAAPVSGDSFMVACVCKLDGCDGLWPITVRDAGLNPARQYACVQTGDLGDPDPAVDAVFNGRWLREPLSANR